MILETNVRGLEAIIEATIKELGYEGLLVKSNDTLDLGNGYSVYGYENVNYPGVSCLWVDPLSIQVHGLVNRKTPEEKEFLQVVENLKLCPVKSQISVDIDDKEDVVQEAIYMHFRRELSDELLSFILEMYHLESIKSIDSSVVELIAEVTNGYE